MANASIFDILINKKLVVFDFDGVIVDSVNIKTEAFAEIYKPFGQRIVDQVITHHINNGGMSRFKKFKHYHNQFLNKSIDDDEIENMSREFSNIVVTRVISSKWIIGVTEFLEKLYYKNINCVIISATPEEELHQIVKERKIEKYFSLIFGSPVSKLDNLKKALTESHVSNNDAIFFGDAMADWEASDKMDVQFVGVGDSIWDLLKEKKRDLYFIKNFEIFNDL
tara:strand:- start:1371 stop:2042 length:672 start_codon:yes stop_codon:yes gene_type:complete